MSAYARCPTCCEVLNFTIDKLGRVREICPVCHEGRKPLLNQHQREVIRRSGPGHYCHLDDCGKEFTQTHEDQRFCSETCRSAYHKTFENLGGRIFAKHVSDLPPRECQYERCGKSFKPAADHQKFCCDRCRDGSRHLRISRTAALKRAGKRLQPTPR